MTLLTTAIEEATTGAGIVSLRYANLQEFNSFLDSINVAQYPLNLVVPIDLDGTFLNNRFKDTLTIQGWVLTRISEDTNDWRSIELEDTYINPMRALARTFLIKLVNDANIGVDPEQETVRYSIKPEYMFMHAHLFGVSYRMNLPVTGNVCR